MSERSSSKEASSERSPWSRPGVLLSGAFLLALVLLGILVAATGGGSGGGRPANRTTAAARPAERSASVSTSGCGLPDGSQSVPWSGPPTAQWGTVGSMQVPQNPAVYGPEHSDGPWETCFARQSLRGAAGRDEPVGRGNGRASRRAVRAACGRGAEESRQQRPARFAAARFSSPATATTPTRPLRLRSRSSFEGPEGKLLAVVTSMVWRDGDWKYVFPTAGTPAMQVIPDLTGYVQWSSF